MVATEKLPVPPIRGGAIQTYIANVAPRLARSGIDLTILGVNDLELPNDEQRDGVRYVRVEGGTLDRYQESVTAFLATEQFDRIHIFNRPRLVAPIAAVAPNSRLSLSLHNEMFLPNKIDPVEAQAAVAAVDRIATVSNFIGQGISTPYPEAGPKLRTIYSGVDATQFVPGWTASGKSMRESIRKQHGLSGKQVVLFVGRLSPKKGADILLRAMEIVAKQVPSAALVLVGSKWYGADEMTDYVAYLQNLAARSSVPVVTTGFITPDQVNQWFAAGDLFVCPSVWQEPLARVHYEAMAAGLPIVTTRRGGNPEVVESTGVGLVVDEPENPEVMARAILTLLKNSSKREVMGQTGRQLALERFTWDRVAGEIATLWAEADEEARRAAEAAVPTEGTTDTAESQPEQGASETKQSTSTKKSSSKKKSSSSKSGSGKSGSGKSYSGKSSSKQKSSSNKQSSSKQESSSKKQSSSKQRSSSKRSSRSGSSGDNVRRYSLSGDPFPTSMHRSPSPGRPTVPKEQPDHFAVQSIPVNVRAKANPSTRPSDPRRS